MGDLNIHPIEHFTNKFNCSTFVETGTGKGEGLAFAARFPFEKLYSIEIMEELYKEVSSKITDSRITILNTSSIKGLETILSYLDERPVLFWLDAHFPGADFHLNSYDYLSSIREVHKPLEKEIEIIHSHRKNYKDCFIIDDLQIYEDGPFEFKNIEFIEKYGENGINFILEKFQDSHNFTRVYRHQGFLILTPK